MRDPSTSRDSAFGGIPPRLRRGYANRQRKIRTRASSVRIFLCALRRRRDSNPRYLAVQQFSRLPPSTTRPRLRKWAAKGPRMLFFFLREELPLEQDQVEGAYRDAAVREVENGLEEDVTAHQRDPVGPGPQGEVEHVHDLALHEGCVMPPGRNHAGRGFRKYQSVEQAINNVAKRAGRNQRQPHQHAGRHRLLNALDQPGNPHRQHYEQHNPERRQRVLADHPAERHAEGHALVLDEQDLEPVPEYREGLAERHIRLDQDLDDLVDDDEDGAEQEQPCSLADLHGLVLSLTGQHFLCLDSQRRVRDQAEPLLGDELAGDAADAVGLVLDAHERGLQVLDELVLALGEGTGFFLGKLEGAVVLHRLEGGGGVQDVVPAGVHHDLAEGSVFRAGLVKHSVDNAAELLEFLVGITGFSVLFHLLSL